MTSSCWRAEVTDDTFLFFFFFFPKPCYGRVPLHLLHSACKATFTTFQIPSLSVCSCAVVTAQECIITRTETLCKGIFLFTIPLLFVEWIIQLRHRHLEVGGAGRGGAQLKWGTVRCISVSVKTPDLYLICMLVPVSAFTPAKSYRPSITWDRNGGHITEQWSHGEKLKGSAGL